MSRNILLSTWTDAVVGTQGTDGGYPNDSREFFVGLAYNLQGKKDSWVGSLNLTSSLETT
jgi:hypothetical protein